MIRRPNEISTKPKRPASLRKTSGCVVVRSFSSELSFASTYTQMDSFKASAIIAVTHSSEVDEPHLRRGSSYFRMTTELPCHASLVLHGSLRKNIETLSDKREIFEEASRAGSQPTSLYLANTVLVEIGEKPLNEWQHFQRLLFVSGLELLQLRQSIMAPPIIGAIEICSKCVSSDASLK